MATDYGTTIDPANVRIDRRGNIVATDRTLTPVLDTMRSFATLKAALREEVQGQ